MWDNAWQTEGYFRFDGKGESEEKRESRKLPSTLPGLKPWNACFTEAGIASGKDRSTLDLLRGKSHPDWGAYPRRPVSEFVFS